MSHFIKFKGLLSLIMLAGALSACASSDGDSSPDATGPTGIGVSNLRAYPTGTESVRLEWTNPDSDNDGIGDIADNCPLLATSDLTDTDNDGMGDA